MNILTAIGYIGVALLLTRSVLRNGVKNWSLNLFASLFMLIFYCLIPFLSTVLYDSSITEIGGYSLPKQSVSLSLECFFVIFIGILTYTVVYTCTAKRSKELTCYNLEDLRFNELNITLIAAYAIIILSTVSCILYIQGFGSFQEAVSMAESIRSGS